MLGYIEQYCYPNPLYIVGRYNQVYLYVRNLLKTNSCKTALKMQTKCLQIILLLTIFNFEYQEFLEKIFKGFSLIPKNAYSTLSKSNTAVTTLNKKISIYYLLLYTFCEKRLSGNYRNIFVDLKISVHKLVFAKTDKLDTLA